MNFFLYLIAAFFLLVVFVGLAKKEQDPIKRKRKPGVIIFFGLLSLIFFIWAWTSSDDSKQSEIKKVAFEPNKLKVEAVLISHQFLEPKLKSPKTAEYPVADTSQVSYLGDSTFFVNSYVDAQNSFGALLRAKYFAKVKYKGDGNWQCLDINLLEN